MHECIRYTVCLYIGLFGISLTPSFLQDVIIMTPAGVDLIRECVRELLVKKSWSLNQMPLEIDKLLDLIKVDENKKPLKSQQYLSLSQANIKTICSSGSILNIY